MNDDEEEAGSSPETRREHQKLGVNSRSSWRFREDVEGLRGLAVLLVLLFHAKVPGFSGGFIGVDVFFVISGYVITGMLMKELDERQRINYGKFYVRRFRRLLPASLLCSVSTVLIGLWILSSPVARMRVLTDFQFVSVFWVNMHFAQTSDYFRDQFDPSPLLHYWSLAVEEQFYAVWPFILGLLIHKVSVYMKSLVWTVLFVGSFGYCQFKTEEPEAFYSLLSRSWQLLAGVPLAVFHHQMSSQDSQFRSFSSLAGVSLILYCGVVYNENMIYPGYASVLPTLGAFLVLSGGTKSMVGRVMGSPVFRWLGFQSYSLYLYHWPAIIYVVSYFSTTNDYSRSTELSLFGLCISIPVAVLSNFFVETPIRNTRVKIRFVSFVCILVAIVLGCYHASGVVKNNIRMSLQRFGPKLETMSSFVDIFDVRNQEMAQDNLGPDAPLADYLSAALLIQSVPPNLQPDFLDSKHPPTELLYGNVTATRSIVLLGDSHAKQWYPAFDMLGRRYNYKVSVYTHANCPPVIFDEELNMLSSCNPYYINMMEHIESLRPTFAFLSHITMLTKYRYFEDYDAVQKAYTDFFPKLKQLGVSPALISDVPSCAVDSSKCLSEHLNDVQSCSCSLSNAVSAFWIEAELDAAISNGVPYVNVVDLFCIDSRCPPIVDHYRVLRDSNHMSDEYARFLAPYFEQKLLNTNINL